MNEPLRDVLRDGDTWADETFPKSDDHAKLTHLREELQELANEPESLEELADCLMLLSHLFGSDKITTLAIALMGHGYDEVTYAITTKLKVCKARDWGEPNADGVVHSRHREAR